ncbi:LacI family transcriptional regulator [Filimonas zeae]|uniref:LacI family transcriptional regulator n=2 Tax=Filimonas zeae TaxID=1737353 RepID=A0A917IZ35_9BACT|nr:LacI family DNA-binding transcriptional regulator [Filimonas zeae]GGH72546.1 LacI family transcriptional regulator [Filimonas zeae]
MLMKKEAITPEVTIYDIASHLGIATSTVSRGLQNNPIINKATRQKIADAAEALGYRRNNYAVNLRTQRTHTIGVIVHELKSHFITSVLAGIGNVAAEAGYDVIIGYSAESAVKEAANARNFFNKRVDGVIASLAMDTKDLSHFQPFQTRNIPLVFFDRTEDHPNSTMVVIDNTRCGYEATSHLIARGCRNIALVTGSLKRNVYAQRYQGYVQALQENGMRVNNDLIVLNELDEQGGLEAAKAILRMSPRPDAVFVTNDFAAAICMRALQDEGLRVPEDIAIVGFNDDNVCRLVRPQLTTIQYPGIEMGQIAARNLIDHLEGNTSITNASRIVVRSQLIIRESSLF